MNEKANSARLSFFRRRCSRLWEIKKVLHLHLKRMGLEGMDKSAEKMETSDDPLTALDLSFSLPTMTLEALGLGSDGSSLLAGLSDLNLDANEPGCLDQMKLLMQAQALLRKSELYQEIDETLQRAYIFQPNVYFNLPMNSEGDDQVTSLHRDTAVNNLRFLNIFYGYNPATFFLSVNLLDRLLGKVKAHPKYLSCIATCCFYIALRTEAAGCALLPCPTELVRLSQCGGTSSDLGRMERLILDKLQWQQRGAVTPHTFLQMFFELLVDHDNLRSEHNMLNSLIAKLEVIMCQFEFTKYRAETVALALLSHWMQEKGLLNHMDQVRPIIELQYYCQITDAEFLQCRGMIGDFLAVYCAQPSKLPRLQLQWTVSRRTISKLKPSSRCILDLEPIMEDEVDSDTDDTGPFDSENDDSELQQALKKKFSSSVPGLGSAMATLEPEEGGLGMGGSFVCAVCPPVLKAQLDFNQNNKAFQIGSPSEQGSKAGPQRPADSTCGHTTTASQAM